MCGIFGRFSAIARLPSVCMGRARDGTVKPLLQRLNSPEMSEFLRPNATWASRASWPREVRGLDPQQPCRASVATHVLTSPRGRR